MRISFSAPLANFVRNFYEFFPDFLFFLTFVYSSFLPKLFQLSSKEDVPQATRLPFRVYPLLF